MVCELEKHWKIKKYWKIKTRGVKHIRKKNIGRFRLWKINPMKLYFFSAKLEHSSKQLDAFSNDSKDEKVIRLHSISSQLGFGRKTLLPSFFKSRTKNYLLLAWVQFRCKSLPWLRSLENQPVWFFSLELWENSFPSEIWKKCVVGFIVRYIWPSVKNLKKI